jgi:hypothetical protein
MELLIKNLILDTDETWGGTPVHGWNINIDDYTEAIMHFNHESFSIVGYFQPSRTPPPNGVPEFPLPTAVVTSLGLIGTIYSTQTPHPHIRGIKPTLSI